MTAIVGMRIGEVAAEAAVNIQTLRYYERVGLLPAPDRHPSGYRAYAPEAVRRVRFIKRARPRPNAGRALTVRARVSR